MFAIITIFLQIAPLPTPFPVVTELEPEVAEQTSAIVEKFWSYDFLAPIFSSVQTFLIWADQYNILTYAIVAVIVLSVYHWMAGFVAKRGEDL